MTKPLVLNAPGARPAKLPLSSLRDAMARVLALLDRRERRQLMMLAAPVVLTAILEAAGVASIIPFLGLLSDPDAIDKSETLRRIYEAVGTETRERFFFVVGTVVLVTLTLGNTTQALTTYALLRFSWMRNHTLSVRLLESYLHRPYSFFVNNNSADLAKNLLTEVQQVVTGVMVQGLQLCARLVVIALIALSLVLVDPVMAVGVTLAFGGLYGIIYMASRRRLSIIGQERLDANAARFKIASEILAGIKELKLLGLESTLVRTYAKPSEVFADKMAKNAIMGAVPRYALETVAFGGALLIILYLLWAGRPLEGALPVLGLYAFAAYRLLPSVQVVFNGVTTIRFNVAALDVLVRGMAETLGTERALDAADDAVDAAGSVEALPFDKALGVRALRYRYDGAERDALADVTFTIARGEWVAVVGPTGSGKTTLVDVLLGLLAPTGGSLLVDELSLSERNARSWQRNVGYVPQQIFLADDTVRRNIAFGFPDDEIDDAAVKEAARIAQIAPFIENDLPSAYDAVVGERGVRLSGGQRQRLGIARALYRKPKLLVLDEATSALDGATEAAFFAALRAALSDRTVISIAHRLSTTESFDRVLLVADGALVADAPPADAIAGRGRFAILHRTGQAA
jgi:ATP-binding cassette, subfamily B, bacterial PglK